MSKTEALQIFNGQPDDDDYDDFRSTDGGSTGSRSYHDVPYRYQGTAADRQDMSTLGRRQVLRRQFKHSTMLAFASSVIVAWELVLVVSPRGLGDGGPAAIFWGLLLSPVALLPVYASLAELASMSPTAGGQYHWVSECAPARAQRVLSYAVGWLVALAWQALLCAVVFEVATLILGLARLNAAGYEIRAWHETLLSVAIVVAGAAVNVVLAARLPLVEAIVLIVHVLGLFIIIIPLWVMAPRGNVHTTLLTFANDSGYADGALATTVGFIPMIGMLIGYDCAMHMSEETHDAARTVPTAVMSAVGVNALMLLVVGWTYVFCLGDLDSVLHTATRQPVIQVFFNATRDHAGTSIIVAVVILILLAACVGQLATASRQLWAFARDRGLPASSWLERVAPQWNVPHNAIAASALITSLLSLINLGSATAFRALTSLGTLALLASYTLTVACVVWRRLRGRPLPPRRWSLGRWGLPLNLASLAATTPMLVFYAWPRHAPATPDNMNWSSAVFGGVLAVAAVYYVVRARHEYVGPVVFVKRDA